jgi:isopentenyl-diphosphate delta-isomerase
LHRAFSVFIFNDKKELLLQRRAAGKYHSSLLWTNTCCGHPRPNEETMHAAQRRLQEEMGFTTSLIKVSSFLYKNSFDNQLIEHELDHVFIGLYNPDPIPHDDEVVAWKYMSLEEIKHDITFHEDDFTYWFKLILQDTSLIEQHLNNLLS